MNANVKRDHISQTNHNRDRQDKTEDFPGLIIAKTNVRATSLDDKNKMLIDGTIVNYGKKLIVRLMRTVDLLALLDSALTNKKGPTCGTPMSRSSSATSASAYADTRRVDPQWSLNATLNRRRWASLSKPARSTQWSCGPVASVAVRGPTEPGGLDCCDQEDGLDLIFWQVSFDCSLFLRKRTARSLRGRRTGIGRIEIEDRTCHEHIEPISQNRACCCRRR